MMESGGERERMEESERGKDRRERERREFLSHELTEENEERVRRVG